MARDDDLAPVQVRLRRYEAAHRRALAMAEYLRSIDPNADRPDGRDRSNYPLELELCGNWIEFDSYPEQESSLLSAGRFCQRYRLCPFCAMRRCARSLQENAPKVSRVYSEVKSHQPAAWLGLLTLTIPNGADLSERFAHIVTSWRKVLADRRRYLNWLKTSRRGRAQPWTFGGAFDGGAYSIEIKRGAGSGLWHPHLHAAVIVTQPLSTTAIADEWRRITGDSHVVDLRPFRSFSSSDDPSHEEIADDLIEVLKYPLKFGDISLSDNWHAELVLSGRRLRGSFGSLWGVKESDDLLDYASGFADLPYVRIAAAWMGDEYRILERQPVSLATLDSSPASEDGS